MKFNIFSCKKGLAEEEALPLTNKKGTDSPMLTTYNAQQLDEELDEEDTNQKIARVGMHTLFRQYNKQVFLYAEKKFPRKTL